VNNHTFTKTLGRVLGRPAILKAPAFAMRTAMGEMADMLLHGQRVMPVRAEQLGFQFEHRSLEPALRSLHL
jgi:NAD dependent epimerase/dehydratase family enzyme